MLKTILGAVLGVLLLSGVSFAQTTISVNIDKAKLVWQAGVGGTPATGFNVKCGNASGSYSKVTQVTVTESAVKDAIDGVGVWFCAVSAFNEFGESGLTNEVSFKAGNVPGDPSKLVIVAQ